MSFFPLVSVITPTYNRASYLSETIESVLSQNYPNIEHIVLDDGSTDDTRKVLQQYSGQLIWDSHPNMGEARTVNKGVDMARGEYVVIVCSDDPVLPGLMQEAVDFLEDHPSILVAYPDWVMIDENGNPLQESILPQYNYLEMLRWHWCQPGPGAFIRRRAFTLAGGRDPKYKYVADFGFWLRLGLHGPFAHIPKTLATWRKHPEGASMAHRGLLMAQEHVALIEDFYSCSDLPPEVVRVKAQAFGAAYRVAAEYCLPSYRKESRRYQLRSLYHYPPGPFIKSRSLTLLIEILLGPVIANIVRSLLYVIRSLNNPK